MKDNKEVNINVRVTKDFKNKLTSFCEQMDISNSVVVRRALAAYFQNEEAIDLLRPKVSIITPPMPSLPR
jgi:antitoxin component of RelBE/YafQ-DinJ toxin-antitoxin module